jgi:hypothetical protein
MGLYPMDNRTVLRPDPRCLLRILVVGDVPRRADTTGSRQIDASNQARTQGMY